MCDEGQEMPELFKKDVTAGINYAYTPAKVDANTKDELDSEQKNESLEELMKKLKKL